MSKLVNFMYESNTPAAVKGKKIADSIIGKLWNWLKKRDFVISNDELIRFLNQISPKNIEFKLQNHKNNLGRYVGYGWIDAFTWKDDYFEPKTEIGLHITDKSAIYLRRFAKEGRKDMFFDKRKNMFYKELLELLTHEIAHNLQFWKSGFKIRFNWEKMDGTYLSNKGEIDAFALQAALQIINGDRSSVWDFYLDFKARGKITEKVYNRFMKKVYMNLQELKRLGMTQ